MNYWHIQLHPGEFEDWSIEDIKAILDYNLIGCSGDPVAEFNKIKPHDVVLVRHGGNVIALVQVLEQPRNTKLEEKQGPIWFDRCAAIEVLQYFSDQYVSGNGWYLPKTLMRIDEDNSIALNYVVNLHKNYLMSTRINELMSLFAVKPQIILQGPPGTGKTRLAKIIAQNIVSSISIKDIKSSITPQLQLKSVKDSVSYVVDKLDEVGVTVIASTGKPYKPTYNEIIKAYQNKIWMTGSIEKGNDSYSAAIAKFLYEDLINSEYIKLIQFHPSYTYEDFVRGITAKSKNDKIEYITVNRVFAEFAKAAHQNYVDSRKDAKSLAEDEWIIKQFEQFKEHIEADIERDGKIPLTKTLNLVSSEEDCFRIKSENWDGDRLKFTEIIKLYKSGITKKSELLNRPEIAKTVYHRTPYYFPVVEKFKDFLKGKVPDFNSAAKVEEKKFVLIIDEINRANLSTVFGELIYGLEYRGDRVESLYDIDGDRSLIIPPNLYIIGTMNTADRSVGHMDYAIRRRFAFVSMPPEEDVITYQPARKLYGDVKSLFVNSINGVDNRADTLAPDFNWQDVVVGHSYFLENDNGKLKMRLEYEIKPLLREYVADGILTQQALQKIDDLHV